MRMICHSQIFMHGHGYQMINI